MQFSDFGNSSLCDVVAPRPPVANIETGSPQAYEPVFLTLEEWTLFRKEQKKLFHLSKYHRSLEGWKRLRPGELTAWEGPGYDFESLDVQHKAGLPVSDEIEEDSVVVGIALAVSFATQLFVGACSMAPAAPYRSALKQKRSVPIPGSWPETRDSLTPWGSAVKPAARQKKSVSFSTASMESCTVPVQRWINVPRDEWVAGVSSFSKVEALTTHIDTPRFLGKVWTCPKSIASPRKVDIDGDVEMCDV